MLETTLDGGQGTDTLIIEVLSPRGDDAPTEDDINPAAGELLLSGSVLRWKNFEVVEIRYEGDATMPMPSFETITKAASQPHQDF